MNKETKKPILRLHFSKKKKKKKKKNETCFYKAAKSTSSWSWSKYLERRRAQAAPEKLFSDPFPYGKHGFRSGMKLEGIDPEHQSLFCVMTVAEVQGNHK